MAITDVGIKNGYYGYYKFDAKNNKKVFHKLGKAITLTDIQRNLDTNDVSLIVKFDYLGEIRTSIISREIFTEIKLVNKLAREGADVCRKTFDCAIDSLRLQESDLQANGYLPINIHENLGWSKLQTPFGVKACFRSYKLLGDNGTYTGDFKITPMGSFDVWREMIINYVLGDTVAEIALLAALAAPIVQIVTPINDPGNPILHLYGISGCGKSTNLELAASVAGEPFEGDRITPTPDGSLKALHSVYRSWSGTVNALIGSCAGNKGYPIILNELGKCQANDLTTLVYNFSEGTDKLRYSKEMKTTQSQGYSTSFISAGEHSLLDRCKDKADGLKVRVLEIEMTKTPDGAKRADHIKAICKRHNGHALPRMAEYIINNNSFKDIQELYRKNCDECLQMWTHSPSYERFISKFVALYLTAADVASQALDIPFNKEAIKDFLHQYDKNNGSQRNSALSSFDVLMEEFNINSHKFVDRNNIMPHAECWGRFVNETKTTRDGRITSARYLVYPNIVNKLLKQHGFNNPNVCIKEWKKANLIDYELGKNTRSRKIDPAKKSVDVFAFNIFEDNPVSKEKTIKLFKEEIA